MEINQFEPIGGVVVPILTILASGVMSSIVTVQLSARLQRRDLFRAKLEEAYAAAHDYCMALTTHFIPYLRVFRGELDINHVNDLTIGTSQRADSTVFRRLEMLVEIYVPDARDVLTRTVALRERLGEVVSQYRRRLTSGEQVTLDLLPALAECIRELDTVEQDFKVAIVRAVRKVG